MAVGINQIMAGGSRLKFGVWIGLIGLLGLMGLMGVGCGPTFNFQGHWVGKRNLPKQPGGDDAVLNTIAKVDLKFLPNGRFELLEGGVPKLGTYRTEGTTAFLRVTHYMDRPISEQGSAAVAMNDEIQVKSTPEGKVIFSDPRGLWQEPVTLTREKEEVEP